MTIQSPWSILHIDGHGAFTEVSEGSDKQIKGLDQPGGVDSAHFSH